MHRSEVPFSKAPDIVGTFPNDGYALPSLGSAAAAAVRGK